MTSNMDVLAELDTMQNTMLEYTQSINDAFHLITRRMPAWQLRRREIIKEGTKRVLSELSERDSVSRNNNKLGLYWAKLSSSWD